MLKSCKRNPFIIIRQINELIKENPKNLQTSNLKITILRLPIKEKDQHPLTLHSLL